ncbi:PTS fructose transporter subunit IIBC, partial [Azospirillum brasilense]|nr:PTS fructose transporter subunit IIBC [Azospirillum argentinense]
MAKLVAVTACPTGIAHTVMAADAVILATDIAVDDSRFVGKPILRTSTAAAIRD